MNRRSIGVLVTGAIIFIGGLTHYESVQGARAIPDNNLSYPVLITLNTGSTASGFYLGDSVHSYLYLVTARHVLFDTLNALKSDGATLLPYPLDPKDSGRNVLELDFKTIHEAENIRCHETSDVAVVRIAQLLRRGKELRTKFFDGVKVKEGSKSGLLMVAIENTKSFDDVLIANEVYVFGYPTSLGLKRIPQLDYDRPLLRRGIVAGKNNSLKTIILDCPAYKGNSGGPVLEAERVGLITKFNVIGVIIQLVPYITHSYSDTTTIMLNSGYSVAIPMEMVLKLLWEE